MDKTNLRRVAQRQSTVGLNSPSIFICCSFLWVKTELSKKPPTYNPGFSASCSFSTNKTFEGQLKQSKPFSYRRFSWLTLCGCQARNKKNLQKNKPYKGFSRFRTDLSLVGLTCALYVLFLIMIMLHGHPFCYAAD